MAEDFPNKMRNMDTQIQEAVYTKQKNKKGIYNLLQCSKTADL